MHGGAAPRRVAVDEAARTPVIGYVGSMDSAHVDGWRGAELGAAEAQRAAELIGRTLEVHAEQAIDSAAALAAARP